MAIESANNVFNFLATTRNTAAVDCLAGLLKSPDTQIAWQAAAAITARAEQHALESFLEAFKSDAESIKYRHWKPLGYRLRPIIGKVLEDSSNPLYRPALVAIVECELVERFASVVRAAEQIGSPHGAFAARLLISLARMVGDSARESGMTSASRDELIRVLLSSIDNFSKHRSQIVVEALLVCSRPEDSHIYSAINEPDGKWMKLLSKTWRSTQRIEAIELLIELVWKHYIPKPLQDIVFHDRKDTLMIRAVSKFTQIGITPHILERLSMSGLPACCMDLDPTNESIPLMDRFYCWLLMANAKAPLGNVLEALIQFQKVIDPAIESLSASLMRNTFQPSFDEWVELLAKEQVELYELKRKLKKSGGGNIPVTEEMTIESYESRLVRLIQCARQSTGTFQQSVKEYFKEFTCDGLVRKVDSQIESVLYSIAKVVRFAHSDWQDALASHLQSPTPKLRCDAVIAASYLGYDRKIYDILQRMLNDENKVVREEVEYAISEASLEIERLKRANPS